MKLITILALGVIASASFAWWAYSRAPTELVLRLDEHFDDVVKNSSFPVRKNSFIPTDEDNGSGVIQVDKPAVIVKYDDPPNGFTLPPTKFAVVTISKFRVKVFTTSPMLEALPFDQAADVLETVQAELRAAGWQPSEGKNSKWFDLSPEGRKQLRAYGGTTELVVPKRNLAMYLNFKCFTGDCDHPNDTARFLIDVSLGKKSWYSYNGE